MWMYLQYIYKFDTICFCNPFISYLNNKPAKSTWAGHHFCHINQMFQCPII